MLGPVVNGAIVVGAGPFDILPGCPIVKLPTWDVSYVSEAVPLCPRLRIQAVFIIISDTRGQCLNFMLEWFAIEGWDIGDIQR